MSSVGGVALNAEQGSVQNFVDGYFKLEGPAWKTALKVISYATLVIPALVLALKLVLKCFSAKSVARLPAANSGVDAVVARTPQFQGYKIARGTPQEAPLLTFALRPANFFYRALLGENATTMPGSRDLFAFREPQARIRQRILAADPDNVVEFSARDVGNWGQIYGDAVYRLSMREVQETIQSQKIFVSPMMPLPFYKALKTALLADGVVTLPGTGRGAVRLTDAQLPHVQALLGEIRADAGRFGFRNRGAAETLMGLTLYQLGALVVKTEDFRIFLDGNGKIRERNVGQRDAVRLINACGIRAFHSTPPAMNRAIMDQTFKTALISAESGLAVFPAVGMGVWGGDPDLYWRAFLDAVVQKGGALEKIYVNPGHQKSPSGRYQGCGGEEFQAILDEYLAATRDSAGQANLRKIVNLFDRKTDLVQLSYELKTAYPNKIVSLFNASDPDVTLGNHVGEYVNGLGLAPTTEENYTALGTNGLCFEGITGVHDDPARVTQAVY